MNPGVRVRRRIQTTVAGHTKVHRLGSYEKSEAGRGIPLVAFRRENSNQVRFRPKARGMLHHVTVLEVDAPASPHCSNSSTRRPSRGCGLGIIYVLMPNIHFNRDYTIYATEAFPVVNNPAFLQRAPYRPFSVLVNLLLEAYVTK